jgi:hypothetical protein
MWNKGVVAMSIFVSVASVIGAVAYSRTFQEKRTVFYDPPRVTEAPLVVSRIQGLQVTEVRLLNQGTTAASIEIDVTNHRDSAVMSLDIISRDKDTSGGITIDGLLDEENPRSIIPAHSLKTFTLGLGEILGEPVFLAAAIFEDGKEEGDKRSLNGIHKSRTNHQIKKKADAKNGS